MLVRPVLAIAALVAAAPLAAQSVADTSPFRSLALPAPGPVRGASGAPGPDYWQQRADYVLRATLDTATHVLSGSGTIHYVNHSPDTLSFVWLQLEPLRGEGSRVGLRLRVVDNGVQSRLDTAEGDVLPLFVPSSMSRGRGLANMERRAEAIGALLTSGPREEGWTVTLEIAPRAPA